MTGADVGSSPDLSDQVVLFVGEAAAIRTACARRLLAGGGKIAVVVPRAWQVQGVKDELGGDRVLVGVVGTRDGEAAAGFVKGAEDALGAITALVFVAGEMQAGPVGRDSDGALSELLASNLFAGAGLVRALVGRLRRRQRGHIVFLGRPEAELPGANAGAAQGALRGYAQGLGDELQGSGVRVTMLDAAGSEPADTIAAGLLRCLR